MKVKEPLTTRASWFAAITADARHPMVLEGARYILRMRLLILIMEIVVRLAVRLAS